MCGELKDMVMRLHGCHVTDDTPTFLAAGSGGKIMTIKGVFPTCFLRSHLQGTELTVHGLPVPIIVTLSTFARWRPELP